MEAKTITKTDPLNIDDLQSSHSILISQTQSLCEVLRSYFENRIGGSKMIEISDSTLASFLYQVDGNLEKMGELVDQIAEQDRREPVKLRLAAG